MLFDGVALFDIEFAESMRKLTDKPPLLAVPFFVISGSIMSRGAIADRLVNVARACFSGLPGGLGIATVIACMFFAAISGSSPVTVITIGGVMYPALLKAGFDQRFSAGLVTSAGTLGILIPPSIPMIVYAIFASNVQVIRVEDLFLAGVGPGLLIGGLLSTYCLWVGWRKGERFSRIESDVFGHIIDGFWSLMLPGVILGGIYSGFFNATEAAAVSVLYSLMVELWIHRSLKAKDLVGVIGESTILMGSLLVIFAMAVGLNDLLAELELPDLAVEWIRGMELSTVSFLLILNGFLLVVGCLMDIMSAIMILVPLLAPMAASYGIDPIHLGIIFIVNLELGYLTPPMGLNLFVASTLFNKPIGEIMRAVLPFIGLLFVALILVTYVPSISLGPVQLLKGESIYVPFPSSDSQEKDQTDTPTESSSEGSKINQAKTIQQLMMENSLLDDEDDEDDDNGKKSQKNIGRSKAKTIQELMKEQGLLDDEDEDDE